MAYAFYRSITVDHTKCGASNATDFPMLVEVTLAELKTVANGGHVQNTASGKPADLVFSPNTDGSSPVAFQVVTYDPTTGLLRAWVKVSTLSASVDTVLYLVYGDVAVVTYQGNDTGTWNANYHTVHHVEDGTTLSLADATATGLTGTNHSATAATGKVGGGIGIVGASSQYVDLGSQTISGTAFALACWLNATSFQSTTPFLRQVMGIEASSSQNCFIRFGDGTLGNNDELQFVLGGSGGTIVQGATHRSTATWYRVWATYDGTNMKIWVNGAQVATGAALSGSQSATGEFDWGRSAAAAGRFFDGVLDELYWLSGLPASPADWILAEYNNQNSPSTFSTAGSEQAAGGGGGGGSIQLSDDGYLPSAAPAPGPIIMIY